MTDNKPELGKEIEAAVRAAARDAVKRGEADLNSSGHDAAGSEEFRRVIAAKLEGAGIDVRDEAVRWAAAVVALALIDLYARALDEASKAPDAPDAK